MQMLTGINIERFHAGLHVDIIVKNALLHWLMATLLSEFSSTAIAMRDVHYGPVLKVAHCNHCTSSAGAFQSKSKTDNMYTLTFEHHCT